MIQIPRSGSAEVEPGGRRIALTRLEQPMWPVAGLIKADLLEYYARVAPVLLPHVAGRPLRVVRFPDGVHLRGVIDEDAPVVSDVASLLELIELETVEIHVPVGGDTAAPAFILFDLAPGAGRDLADCCAIAARLRALLTGDGLAAHVKTSGSFGLHVAVPVNGGAGAAEARAYARATAERLAKQDPELITCDARRAGRSGRVLVDWRPNAPRRATVAAYSLRAMLPGPGVSAPVGWDDVEAGAEGQLEALHRAPADVLAFNERHGDAWRPVLDTVQAVPPAD